LGEGPIMRETAVHEATRRRYLMCPPTYFDVVYAINPWMRPNDEEGRVDTERAVAQWTELKDTYERLGHEIHVVDPVPGLPDMVFAANGGVVLDGRVFGSRFRYVERLPEAAHYLSWFKTHGSRLGIADIYVPLAVAEGEGDILIVGDRILAATGFRTEPQAHRELADYFGREVLSLELVDPRFYHLDTALAVLDDETVAYYPPAFTPESRELLRMTYPDAIIAHEADVMVLGLNAVSDGKHVVLPVEAKGFAEQLSRRGFEPVPVDLSELRKAGGGPKCCTLELRVESA